MMKGIRGFNSPRRFGRVDFTRRGICGFNSTRGFDRIDFPRRIDLLDFTRKVKRFKLMRGIDRID